MSVRSLLVVVVDESFLLICVYITSISHRCNIRIPDLPLANLRAT